MSERSLIPGGFELRGVVSPLTFGRRGWPSPQFGVVFGAVLAVSMGHFSVLQAQEKPTANPGLPTKGASSPEFKVQGQFHMTADNISFVIELGILEESGVNQGDDANRRHMMRFQADSLDYAIFDGDRERGIRKLNEILDGELKLLERVTPLTDSQKRKLRLAGRGDIHRLLERIESLRPEFEKMRDAINDGEREPFEVIRELMNEAALVRRHADENLIGDDSLFEKNLRKIVSPDEYPRIVTERDKLRPPQKQNAMRRRLRRAAFQVF